MNFSISRHIPVLLAPPFLCNHLIYTSRIPPAPTLFSVVEIRDQRDRVPQTSVSRSARSTPLALARATTNQRPRGDLPL